jgi:hypothetical protein
MYLRESRQKRADGSVLSHLQLVESVWNPARKRSELRILYNFGQLHDPRTKEQLKKLVVSLKSRLSPDELVDDLPGFRVLDAWPYGALYVLETLWKRLGLGQVIEKHSRGRKFGFSIERALFALVANRALAPCSKLYCYEQWLREDVRLTGAEALSLQHLYRAMDFLIEHKEVLEQEVYFQVAELLNLEVDLLFYDTTSLHFENDEEDPRPNAAPEGEARDAPEPQETEQTGAGSGGGPARTTVGLRQRGYSKNGRDDAPQVVVGLVVTRDGIPVKHWVFPGNTVDVTTVEQVKAELKGWKLSRCVFVGDAGMLSQSNLKTLSLGGGRYILGAPFTKGGEVCEDVLSRPGRYKAVADNLHVKEVWVGEGERRRRYILCHNPLEEKRQRKHRAKVLDELRAELATLSDKAEHELSRRKQQLLLSRRYGRYLRTLKGGGLKLDQGAIKEAEHNDGKYVLQTNDDTLTAEDVALGYKQLLRVEQAWRTMKTGLKLRPVYHRLEHRIRAHIALTVLSLLLERVAERACQDTWRNIRDDLKQIKLAQLSGPHGDVWQTTRPGPDALKRLKSLQIDNPPEFVKLP